MSIRITHLSKGLSDLKQNGTREDKPFSGTVCHTFSQGVICYVANVILKTNETEASDWL